MSSKLVCLDVAIDHRIRRQIKPGTREHGEQSTAHIIELESLYRSITRRDYFEFLTTVDLAGPRRRGGILVALERPTNSHPFSDGTHVVVEESPTLRALRDAFELFDLSILGDVSVVDAFPFLSREEISTMSTTAYNAEAKRRFSSFLAAVLAKQPDVVLCMWQCDKTTDLRCFGSGCGLQSMGVGLVFPQPRLTLVDKTGARADFVRVNAFHPSFAVNYHPEYSCFRQLLVLQIAHACGLWNGHWNEEPWMEQLRNRCNVLSSQLGCISGPPTLGSLRSTYAAKLRRICQLVTDMVLMPRGQIRIKSRLYGKLISNNWTEPFNDSALCLKEIGKRMGAQAIDLQNSREVNDDFAIRTMSSVMNITSIIDPSVSLELNSQNCIGLFSPGCIDTIQKASRTAEESWYRNKRLKEVIIEFLVKLGNCFTREKDEGKYIGPYHLMMSLSQASHVFLDTAKAIEVLLDDLCKEARRAPNTDNDSKSGLEQVSIENDASQILSEGISEMRLMDNSNGESKVVRKFHRI